MTGANEEFTGFEDYVSDRVFNGVRELTPDEWKKHISAIARSLAAQAGDLQKKNQELQTALSCMTASRDRWKAEAKGKITDEWRRRVAAGEDGA